MYKDGKDDYREGKKPYLTEDKESVFGRQKRQKELEYEIERQKTREILIRQGMPRMEDQTLTKIKLNSSKVVGSIFDRVIFLETRIDEIKNTMEIRQKIHSDMIKDIDKDVDDKESIAAFLSDQNERRNLKLDISVLRKEKRHEHVQFWKDITELTLEMRELLEQHETEKKIASLFNGVGDA